MGDTKLERFIFTLIICFLMVLVMSIYNLYLALGSFEHLFRILIKDFWLGFLIALFLDTVIMTRTAKPLAFLIIERKNIKHIALKVLTISSCMVVGMVLTMSLYGAVKNLGFSSTVFKAYPRIVLFNFILAWPLNILIVNPVARLFHSMIFPVRNPVAA